jgi:hypothetical protein
MEKTIKVDEKDVTIFRSIDESNKIYNYRYNYIKDNIETEKLKKLIINSKIITNIKFKKCRYEPKIYNLLKKFII